MSTEDDARLADLQGQRERLSTMLAGVERAQAGRVREAERFAAMPQKGSVIHSLRVRQQSVESGERSRQAIVDTIAALDEEIRALQAS